MKVSKKDIPQYLTPIFETHCHLDYLKDLSISELLKKTSSYNIKKLMTIAVSIEHLNKVIDLANQYDHIYCSQGIHPHESSSVTQETYQIVQKNIQENKKVIAVGEIGLDYYYKKSPQDIQRKVFERFLEMAIELDKPVIIHTREAEDDTIDILKNILPSIKKPIVFHSFTSSSKLADFAAAHNIYLGVNGIITFNKSNELRAILKNFPLKQLVLETDCPFLTPAPYRGKENAPFYLPFIARKLAEVKELEVDELLLQCWANSHQLFDLDF